MFTYMHILELERLQTLIKCAPAVLSNMTDKPYSVGDNATGADGTAETLASFKATEYSAHGAGNMQALELARCSQRYDAQCEPVQHA